MPTGHYTSVNIASGDGIQREFNVISCREKSVDIGEGITSDPGMGSLWLSAACNGAASKPTRL